MKRIRRANLQLSWLLDRNLTKMHQLPSEGVDPTDGSMLTPSARPHTAAGSSCTYLRIGIEEQALPS